jgi:hypothetical protein
MAQRTLVKSPPELWAEVSDLEALSKHLGEFGDIRITRLEPQSTVAWEGDRACGTVELEPAGWGTRVTLQAAVAPPCEPAPAIAPAVAPPRTGLLARLLRRAPAPARPPQAAPVPAAPAAPPVDAERVLVAVLDSLGSARHRPFSRG